MPFRLAIPKNKNSLIILAGILALILTFPAFDMSFSFGIDPCLPWVFHHLQEAGFDKGQEIIFPYGPLTFLMYPLYMNPFPAVFTYIFLALSLFLLLAKLMSVKEAKSLLLPFIFSLIILTVSGFNLLLFSVIAVSYLTYMRSEKTGYLFFGLVLTSVGVFIKINVAILSGALTFAVLLFILFRNKNYILVGSGTLLVLLTMILVWFGMYGNLEGFFEYFIGLLHLASGNSSATALFPDNNWLYLSLAIGFLVITFILIRSQRSSEFAVIFFLPLFAAWKHGVGRQDYLHYLQFLHFMLIIIILLFAITRTKKTVSILSGMAAVLFLYLNFNSIKHFPSYSYNLRGPVNLYNLITDYQDIKEKAEIRSGNNIKLNKLPNELLEEISNHTVDVYPWDYSIIAANDLNWRPRPGLQSFLGYSTWLDRRNYDHFQSEKVPEFIIWHYNPFNSGVNPGRMESVDERYLLNDEPLTIRSVLKNYELYKKSSDFILFRKRNKPLNIDERIEDKSTLRWNSWLQIPEIEDNSVIVIKPEFERNLYGELINFLYKDTPIYLVAETDEGLMFRYRISPGNSSDGLWLNPLIQNLSGDGCPHNIKRIMFQAGYTERLKQKIAFKITSFSLELPSGQAVSVDSLIGKTGCIENNIVFSREELFSEGERILEPGGYSKAIAFSPDTLHNDEFWIQVGGFVKVQDNPDAKLVLEFFEEEERIVYKAASFSQFYVESESLSPVQMALKFDKKDFDNLRIKSYFWNASTGEIEISSLKMKVITIQDP